MKKGLAIFLICLSFFTGFFVNKTIAKENQGLKKTQMEKLINRKISKDEWRKMTQDGEVEMIGGADGPTQIYTESDK
ncbi:hypothetical protein [Peptoniphilus sp. DNF00840]|uniref:hypothetical protein n=1 Tax=Peptoniphilus sp. DNF00840 TaxID=1477000 RepID=UPI0007848834|nr:hypothetical protein [Peptoniphilus sp. DNF00840]KXB71955.1 hypothetical protein HMPREF1864_00322 [Peptoniphilus sp. DNF00840]